MKAAFIIFAALFVTKTAFAESRGILIEFPLHHDSSAVVNIYSDEVTERKSGVSVAEAATVLRNAAGWGMVSVYVLSEGRVQTKDLLVVLGGMKDNPFLEVALLEAGSLSERGKTLLSKYKDLSNKRP